MMKRLLRWIAIALGALVALGVMVFGVVYVLSERILTRSYAVPASAVSIPTDAAALTEGRRLATIHGCLSSDCHGMHGEGHVVFDQPMIARIVAPNLTSAVRRYTDAQLAGVIRQGVRPGGSVLVMPSEAFVALTDADLGRILAFLKSLPAVDGPGPSISPGPVGRIGLAVGKFKTAPQLIAEAATPPEATSEEAAFGRYLARTVCAECHGGDLRGASNPDFTTPGLAVVAAYSPDAFTALLRTGVPLGGRTLRVMGPRARENLSYLTDPEINALYGYLHATRW
jgi:cytochrome c553